MEGKSAPEVKAKWEMAFVGSYSKSLCVFGPTQIVNFTLTPPQHRLAVQQLVGLGESLLLTPPYHTNMLFTPRDFLDWNMRTLLLFSSWAFLIQSDEKRKDENRRRKRRT